jgi:hypothetical protein
MQRFFDLFLFVGYFCLTSVHLRFYFNVCWKELLSRQEPGDKLRFSY